MYIALARNHEEAAIILARKGADCTPKEQQELGNEYTSFKQRIQAESSHSKPQQAPQPILPRTTSAPHTQPLQPSHSEQEIMQLKQKIEELEERLENTEAALQRSEKIKRTLLLTRQLRFVAFEEIKVVNVLGQGSNGIVFLVEIPLRIQTTVQLALKMILNLQQINTTKLSNHFVNEFDVLFKLVDIHPNIIHILADFTDAPTLQMINALHPSIHDLLFKKDEFGVEVPVTTQFFLIEYHPATLEQVLKERKLQAAEIYRFAGELLDCFVFLFENRVAHRDVKPDNIFVSSEGSLILGDFGEAAELDENHCCSVHNLRAGNMRFTAPEVINQLGSGKKTINFAKQYSWEVGCLLFEMVYGKFPFENYPLNFGKAPKISVPSAVFGASVVDVAFLAIINKLLISNHEFRISIKDAHSQFQQFLKR